MDNFDKIQKLKLALRGLDIHLKKLNRKKSETMLEGVISNTKYSYSKAEQDVADTKKNKYLVTTINWTFTNLKSDEDYNPNIPSPNLSEVYKRQYVVSISDLFKLQSKLSKLAVKEQIIKIEPFVTDNFF